MVYHTALLMRSGNLDGNCSKIADSRSKSHLCRVKCPDRTRFVAHFRRDQSPPNDGPRTSGVETLMSITKNPEVGEMKHEQPAHRREPATLDDRYGEIGIL